MVSILSFSIMRWFTVSVLLLLRFLIAKELLELLVMSIIFNSMMSIWKLKQFKVLTAPLCHLPALGSPASGITVKTTYKGLLMIT